MSSSSQIDVEVADSIEVSESVSVELGELSPSVQDVVRHLSSQPVTAWDVVMALTRSHPEYAGETFGSLELAAPRDATTQPVVDWIAAAWNELDRSRVPMLFGRLLVLALCRAVRALSNDLARAGVLDSLRSEIRERPVELLFRGDPDPTSSLHLDDPSRVDELQRHEFAQIVAERLLRVWSNRAPSRARSSFMVHLHGTWGSGKSTLLKLMEQELQRGDHKTKSPPPIVVTFNAWEHQRLDPPWWPLIDAIFRQGSAQLPWLQRRSVRLRELLWRTVVARVDTLTVVALAVMVLALGYGVLRIAPSSLKLLNDEAKAAKDIAASAVAAGATMLVVARSLLPGSIRAAQAFVHAGGDPLEKVRAHFGDLVSWLGRPVFVFVDDLDRCHSKYIVSLLEGVQTLFGDTRVVYVVAADGRWLHAAFEDIYSTFSSRVREPGRPMGAFFVEKAFELSVAVPRISPPAARQYLRNLLGGTPPTASDRTATELPDIEEADERSLITAFAATPLNNRARRTAIIERLASPQIERETSFFLEPFLPLMESNPRSTKRLLNAYSINRDIATLAGIDILSSATRKRQLVLWTILCLRWPVLEEYLVAQARGRALSPSEEVTSLLAMSEVRDVIGGRGVTDTALDLTAIAEFTGSPPQSPS